MKKFLLSLCCIVFAAAATLNGQRYLNEVFTSVKKTAPVPYGENYSVIRLPVTGHTFKQPLVMDVYEPDGDTETARPLVLILHTGNFVPWPQNGGCRGARTDSSNVLVATRLAKMGYVVCCLDYRKGWNPIAPDETTRRFGIINAAYRGVQDVRTCIRYFRKTADVAGNPWKINPNQITVWGFGTGGYVALAAASLDDYFEIINTSEPGKFIVPGTNPPIPMVIPQYNGDIYGTSGPHVSDAAYAGITGIPAGDTLAIPNHVGYSSDFALAVNLGGALGDINWWEADSKPLISIHDLLDPFAPCGDGTVLVPPPFNLSVVNVSGSCSVQEKIRTTTHNNDIFREDTEPLTDGISTFINSVNGGRFGFFPFNVPSGSNRGWEWGGASGNPPVPCDPDGSDEKVVLDSLVKYFAPRACRALGLSCPGINTESNEPLIDVKLQIYPNPASTDVMFMNDSEYEMLGLELFSADGKLVRSIQDIRSNNYTLRREGLPVGIYTAKVRYQEGVVARRIIFE